MRRIGGTGMRRRYGGWRWIGRGKLPRAPKSFACARHRLLPARDPSALSPLEDEAVQRSRRRLFRLGAREKAVASHVARLNRGFPAKKPITETGKGRRCTCPKELRTCHQRAATNQNRYMSFYHLRVTHQLPMAENSELPHANTSANVSKSPLGDKL